MTKTLLGLPEETRRQLKLLAREYGSLTQAATVAIELLYREYERRTQMRESQTVKAIAYLDAHTNPRVDQPGWYAFSEVWECAELLNVTALERFDGVDEALAAHPDARFDECVMAEHPGAQA